MKSSTHEVGAHKAETPRWLSATLRVVLALLAFVPLAQLLYQRWPEVRSSLGSIHWGNLTLSVVLLMIVLPFHASMSWVVLRSLRAPLSAAKVFALYFITQIVKYLPGGIWAFPGRVVAYQIVGVGRVQSVVSVFREVAVLFLGAVIVGSLVLIQGAPMEPAVQLGLLVCVLACVAAALVAQFRFFWRLAASLPLLKSSGLAKIAQSDSPETASLFSLTWLPGALACSLLFWLAMGVPFYMLILAISPAAPLSWPQAASLFALSWSAGFAVVFVPAGFGVRESVLTLLISPFVPFGDALSIALLSRLWWVAVEAVCIVVSLWLLGDWRKYLRRKFPS